MYSAKQIAKLELLKDTKGKAYTFRSITELLKLKKYKKKKTRYGEGYLLTDEDIRKLQNLINKRNGIWNTPKI